MLLLDAACQAVLRHVRSVAQRHGAGGLLRFPRSASAGPAAFATGCCVTRPSRSAGDWHAAAQRKSLQPFAGPPLPVPPDPEALRRSQNHLDQVGGACFAEVSSCGVSPRIPPSAAAAGRRLPVSPWNRQAPGVPFTLLRTDRLWPHGPTRWVHCRWLRCRRWARRRNVPWSVREGGVPPTLAAVPMSDAVAAVHPVGFEPTTRGLKVPCSSG